MSNDLNDLLEKKPFSELTSQERSYALSQITEQEYDWQREVILSAKQAFDAEPKLIPLPPTAALAALQKNKKSTPFLFVHKVPTWMAVAACLLVFFLAKGSGFMQSEKQPLLCTEIIDTVFVEKMVRSFNQEKNVLKEDTLIAVNSPQKSSKITPIEKLTEPVTNPPVFTTEMLSIGNINYDNYFSNYSNSGGLSLQNDSITQLVNNAMF